ncbi:MAG: VgrG-related protein [Litorilinea sp.]
MAKAQSNLSSFVPLIDGKELDHILTDIDEIIVDTSLHLPDMCFVRLQDSHMTWVDLDSIDFGKPLKINVAASDSIGGGEGTIFEGEITAIEPHFSAQGAHLLGIRAYDKSNRLHRNKVTRTFTNQSDSDIAKTIANDAGLSPDVDVVADKHEYILQNNQTNMEFLAERAQAIGYQVFVQEGKLYFKKGSFRLSGTPPVLNMGEELRSFHPRHTAANQANKVRVVSWDWVKGERILKEVDTTNDWNMGGFTANGGATVKGAYAKADQWAVITDSPVATDAQATLLAEGLASDIGSEFVEAEGVAYGDPAIRAGMLIELKGIGKRYSGKYFITSATHVFNAYGYETHFMVSGRQPLTFNQLLANRNGQHGGSSRITGVVVGIVTDNNDTDQSLGRVKVKYPWLAGPNKAEIASNWARLSSPMGGRENKGFFWIPEVDDEVLLAFEHGNPNRPYVVGVLWSAKNKPPTHDKAWVQEGRTLRRMIRTQSGHKIVIDDSTDSPQILIQDKTEKNLILIDTKNNNIEVKATNDFVVEAGRDIKMTAKGKVLVDAGGEMKHTAKGKLTIETTSNSMFKAGGMADFTSPNTMIEGKGKMVVQGGMVEVTGKAMVKIDAAQIYIG